MVKLVPIGSVKGNSRNPRFIRDEKFKKLVASLVEFPEMANLRPLVVDENMTVLGGNMRLKAMQELKWKEVPIVVAEGLTDAQKDEFVIKDNVGFGDWNWEQLANEWDAEELTRWGLDIPGFDFSEANEEIDIDSLDTEMVIKLKYTEEEYQLVKEQLSKIASTPEQAVWKLLGNE
jgi:ParB-like chromosome segregation protein Spo0J